MRRKRLILVKKIVWTIAGLAGIATVTIAAASQSRDGSATQPRTSGKSLKPVLKEGEERPSVVPMPIPHPGATEPAAVVRNIKAIVRHTNIGVSEIPELASDDIRARRVLEVRSELPPPGYLVVELEDSRGNRIANFAVTKLGNVVMVEDQRNFVEPRPLELKEAAARVQVRRGETPTSIEYVYFNNVAEPGLSYCRPLIAVKTRQGVVYLNSVGEAFEDADPAVFAAEKSSVERPRLGRRARVLKALGKWE
jgi:hypothetical protein